MSAKQSTLDEEAASKFSTHAAMEAGVKREAAERAERDAMYTASLGSAPEVHIPSAQWNCLGA